MAIRPIQSNFDTLTSFKRKEVYKSYLEAEGAVKTDETVSYKRISDDRIEVTLVMSFNENIGIKREINEWQMEENTDDKTD